MSRKERIDALKQLAAKVEAGDIRGVQIIAKRMASAARDAGETFPSLHVEKAMCGSLDAAKALMEAVLPWWSWRVAEAYGPNTDAYRTLWVSRPESWRTGHTADALKHGDARAWLLAILRAMIAMEEAK